MGNASLSTLPIFHAWRCWLAAVPTSVNPRSAIGVFFQTLVMTCGLLRTVFTGHRVRFSELSDSFLNASPSICLIANGYSALPAHLLPNSQYKYTTSFSKSQYPNTYFFLLYDFFIWHGSCGSLRSPRTTSYMTFLYAKLNDI